MTKITELEALKEMKKFMSEELNKLQDKIRELESGEILTVLVPNTAISEIQKLVKNPSANDIAIILAWYELRNLTLPPQIIGAKFGEPEYVKVYYKST